MNSANYKFVRSKGIDGFCKSKNVSTDALNVLLRWESLTHTRSFEKLSEEHYEVLAKLNWDSSDMNAGAELSDACQAFGVERVYVNS